MKISERILRIMHLLKPRYPAKGMVDLGNPEDTLMATVLSAQTTDLQVLKVYPGFRKRFPRLEDLAAASQEEVEPAIASINYYRHKATFLRGIAQRLLETYRGQVPDTMEALLTLPGVGRKTASCVLWYGFQKPAMAVDTHVFRIAHRLGWASGNSAETVEQELMRVVPRRWWGTLNRIFVPFGRDICRARKPECWRCPVAHLCPFEPKQMLKVKSQKPKVL